MNADLMAGLMNYLNSGVLYAVQSGSSTPALDLSIEGMRSQQFSVGVFFFMLLGVGVFAGIIYVVAFGRAAPKSMKRGEKVMFGAIIAGTVLAVVFGGMQLLNGDLF